MKVVEIFSSIDGEGKRTGQLATFVRLYGCNLRCGYCDTKYSFDCNEYVEMTAEEIVNRCREFSLKNITLTGGEPLIHKGVKDLIISLCENGFYVNVETNGTVDLMDYISLRNTKNYNLFFTVDFKVPSSGMRGRMNVNSFLPLDREKDLVKCVVGNKEDMNDSLQYLDKLGEFNIWFSPIFGDIEPKEIVEYVLSRKREDITVQVQLHKIIWDVNERGV